MTTAIVDRTGGRSLRAPIGTRLLCLTNIVLFVAQCFLGLRRSTQGLGLLPGSVWHWPPIVEIQPGQWLPPAMTLFSHMFLHANWFHLASNMCGLWVFGAVAEQLMGTRKFVLTYLVFGLITGLVIAAVVPYSLQPMVGASGAIVGVLGAGLGLHYGPKLVGSRQWIAAAVELSAIVIVSSWFALRTVPQQPDRVCSIVYHAVPFLLAWLVARAWTVSSARRTRAAERGAEPAIEAERPGETIPANRHHSARWSRRS